MLQSKGMEAVLGQAFRGVQLQGDMVFSNTAFSIYRVNLGDMILLGTFYERNVLPPSMIIGSKEGNFRCDEKGLIEVNPQRIDLYAEETGKPYKITPIEPHHYQKFNAAVLYLGTKIN